MRPSEYPRNTREAFARFAAISRKERGWIEMSNLKLKFDPDLCEECATYDCLVRCQYLNLDLEAAREERKKLNNGEDSVVLHRCATCYACNEYCQKGNYPFYQLVELQEQKGIWTAPKPIVNQQIKMFSPKGDFLPGDIEGTPFNLCLFPALKKNIKGQLFEKMTIFSSRDLFCNLVYLHFARSSVIKERAPQVIENFARCNIKELVCFHDECYGFFASWAPAYGLAVPFKAIHLFEYLREKLKEKQIKKLGLKIAYQRPCSSRLTPWKEPYLDEIFDLIGVERVPRKYDRENALCCGGVFRMQARDELADDVNERNIEDMLQTGATVCVFNCPACYMTMGEMVAKRGLMPVLIGDLCRLAAGEQLDF